MIVEDPPGEAEQLADERVIYRISHSESFFSPRDDVLIPEHGQLLRDDRLIEHQCLLQFLHRPSASHEDLQHADPDWVGQRAKEPRLEYLELTGGLRFGGSAPAVP
jgi:hypothetical protein